jgi:hypothetical protein
MANISPTLKVDISFTPTLMTTSFLELPFPLKRLLPIKLCSKSFMMFFHGLIHEILRLDPNIVEHHIDTWLDTSPIRQKRPIHPPKALVIKAKIDKLKIRWFH